MLAFCAFLVVSLPAIFGASVFYLLSLKISSQRSLGLLFIALGCGFSSGYLLIARVMWVLDQANLRVFRENLIFKNVLFNISLQQIVQTTH